MLFQMYISSVLWGDNSQARNTTQPMKAERNDTNYDTGRNYDLFSIGSTVVVQWEDGGPWTHGTIIGTGDHNHNNRLWHWHATTKNKKELWVCESLRKMTSAKAEWMWNTTYQNIFDKAKAIIKEDACMRFYDKTKPLYIETDASGVGSGAAPLQARDKMSCHRDELPDNIILRPIAFPSKSLTGAEKR